MTARALVARHTVLGAALALGCTRGGTRGDTRAADTATIPTQIAAEGGASAAGAAAADVAATGVDGAALYGRCASCHQPAGQGIPVYYPPLAGSSWVTGDAAVPIRIVLHGLVGPVTVSGRSFDSVMGAYGGAAPMSDAEVAAVVTYVRASWGNRASPVTAAQVAAERAATRAQSTPYAAAALTALTAAARRR